MRAAIYARVSTFDQEPENQLQELRRYVQARGWTGKEYVDRGVSGAKDRRPALDTLILDAKRRKFDVLVCWRLDRLGRNLRHLVTLLEDLNALGAALVSLNEGIDCTTTAGKPQLHILAELSEFERGRIQERVGLIWRVRGRKASSSDDHTGASTPTSWHPSKDCRSEKRRGGLGSALHATSGLGRKPAPPAALVSPPKTGP